VFYNIINFYDSFKKNIVQYLLYIKIDNKIFLLSVKSPFDMSEFANAWIYLLMKDPHLILIFTMYKINFQHTDICRFFY